MAFLTFDEARIGDLTGIGLEPLLVVYESAMIAPGDSQNDPPDPAYLDGFFANLAASNPGVDRVVLDYEAWTLVSGGSVNTTVMGWYITLVEAAQAHFANVGLYGELPERYYLYLNYPVGHPTHVQRKSDWLQRNIDMQPLWDTVDSVYPSLYYLNPVHDTAAARDLWYEDVASICETRAPGKEFIGFMWPRIHSSVDPTIPWIDGAYYRASLEKLLSIPFTGYALWLQAGDDHPETENPVPGWWTETISFQQSLEDNVAVSLGVGAADTANQDTYATGSFTPAANDLLLALAALPATVDAGDYTSSDAGKTYSKVTSSVWSTGANTFYAFVADQLADADSQTGTMDVTGDTAAGRAQTILRISGMSQAGAVSIRQFKVANDQAGGIAPTVTFDAACLAENPVVFAIAGSSSGTPTAPTDFTLIDSQTFSTPTTGMKVWARDSGFTGTTITCNSTYSAVHAVIAIELSVAEAPVGDIAQTLPALEQAAAGTSLVAVSGDIAQELPALGQSLTSVANPPILDGGFSIMQMRRRRR